MSIYRPVYSECGYGGQVADLLQREDVAALALCHLRPRHHHERAAEEQADVAFSGPGYAS